MNMKVCGWVLVGLGLAQMVWAGFFSVSVGGDYANIDLIGQRELLFLGGGFGFLAGWVALGAHHVREAIEGKPAPKKAADLLASEQY